MKALFIETSRKGYGPDQCGRTMTVGELISLLSDFDEDRPVYLRNDNGYTYYTDNGRELAFYTDDGRGEAYSKVLYFNADLMAVQSQKCNGMTYIERAKPEYMDDFRKVEALHPGIPQSEFTNI